MPCLKPFIRCAAIAAFAIADVASASVILPANPKPFERVNLRKEVDSCVFDEERVFVDASNSTIRIRHQPLACLQPGPPEVVDIQLGAFPVGNYHVEYFDSPSAGAEPVERLYFEVRDPNDAAFVPPTPRPLTDYSGLWWKPSESGWGLSLAQGPQHSLFGVLLVFGANEQPTWFTVQAGRWTTSTVWTGLVAKATGPSWMAPVYDPARVTTVQVGTATLDFGMTPRRTDVARFTYTIDGTTVTADISRVSLF
jgi:hypothetical protein